MPDSRKQRKSEKIFPKRVAVAGVFALNFTELHSFIPPLREERT